MKWLILAIALGVFAVLGSIASFTNLRLVREADEYLEKQRKNGAETERIIEVYKERGGLESSSGRELVNSYARWVEIHREALAGRASARLSEAILVVASLAFYAGAAVALRKHRRSRPAATAD